MTDINIEEIKQVVNRAAFSSELKKYEEAKAVTLAQIVKPYISKFRWGDVPYFVTQVSIRKSVTAWKKAQYEKAKSDAEEANASSGSNDEIEQRTET